MLNHFGCILTAVAFLVLSGMLTPALSRSRTLVEELAELSIEELMSIESSSTSFFDIPPEKAPGSIYLISGDRIENSFASSISGFLEYYVPGVHISRAYTSGTLYSTRGIASSSNATTLLMLDGESMNISNGTGINTNLDLPLLGYVDRIEVLKGPCSIIHGSGSINGFVNVVQKTGKEYPGAFVNAEVGFPQGLVKTETGYGLFSRELGDLFLYAGMVESDGIKEGDIRYRYLPEINSRFSVNWKKNNFKLTTFIQSESVNSTLKFKEIDQDYSEVSMKSVAILPEMAFQLTDTEVLTVGLPVQYFEYEPNYLDFVNEHLDSEWQLKSKVLLKTTRFSDHHIAMGFSLVWKRIHSDNILINYDDVSHGGSTPVDKNISTQDKISFDVDSERLETALFFEDNYHLTRNVTLFAGIRYDEIYSDDYEFFQEDGISIEFDGDKQGIMTPRLGITWEPGRNQIVKFIYQEGYHYPDFLNFMIYGDLNELLQAEEVRSYELGYHRNFMENRGSFNFNVYYNVFYNMISYRPSSNDSDGKGDAGSGSVHGEFEASPDEIESLESDRFAAAGFETTFSYAPDELTRVELSYAFSHPHTPDDSLFFSALTDKNGEYWKLYPRHTVKLNWNRRLLDGKVDVTMGCLYNRGIKTMEDNEAGENDLFDHDRFVVNAALRYHLTDACSLIIRGENIFNNDVPAAGYYYDSLNRQNASLEEPIYTIGLNWKF